MARIERAVEVNASPDAVYERLLHFEEYPSFMHDVRGVRRIGALGLQWETGHGERARSWEAEITQQIPGRRLAWRHVHGPRYEAAIELAPLGTEVGAAATRVTLALECEPAEQMPAEVGEPQRALQERMERDLERLKKHVERNDPSGMHVVSGAARGAGAGGAAEPTAGVGVGHGRTAAQGEASRKAGASREPEHGRMRPWRRAPTLPELWDLWQQPLRMARRMSHDVERVIDTVRGKTARPSGAGAGGGTPAAGASETIGGAWTPAVETEQREREFIVSAELPGMKCEEVQVEIKHDRLTIAGERRPQPWQMLRGDRYSERNYGHFYRSIALPPGAQPEQAEAAMHDGLLEIKVPLAEHADQPRRLEVRPVRVQ